MSDTPKRRLRSEQWFNDPAHADMTALYVERYMNSVSYTHLTLPTILLV